MVDISIIAIAGEIMDRVETGRSRRFTEQERYEVSRFAFKSDSPELTECLVVEMAYSLHNTQPVINRFNMLLENEDECSGKIKDLLVLLEMLRLKKAKAINELKETLRKYGYDIVLIKENSRDGQSVPSGR